MLFVQGSTNRLKLASLGLERWRRWLDQWPRPCWTSGSTSASDCFIREVLNQISGNVGVLDVCPTAEEIQDCIAQVAKKQRWKPIAVLGIDGADVPTRPETAKGTGRGRKNPPGRSDP